MSKSPSLRRIQADIRELALDPSDRYHAAPLENDMFEWHFTIRGADGTDFEGGVYHGRIMLPPEYPFKPPHIIFLTPSGRFETNTKVCLSFSAYHPELWQPAWGIRLILEALISFLPTPADGAIGALDWTSTERKRLAQRSVNYVCPTCGCKAIDLLPKLKPKCEDAKAASSKPSTRFQKEIAKLQELQHIQHGAAENNNNDDGDNKKEAKKEASGETNADEKETKEPSTENDDNKEEQPAPAPTSSSTPENPDAAATIRDEEGKEDERRQEVNLRAGMTTPTQPQYPRQNSNDGVREAAEEQQRFVLPPEPQPVMQQQQQFAQVQQQQQHHEDDGMLSWMLDPVLHGVIVVLAILCFLLLRKVQAMMDELEQLKEVLEG